MSRMAGSAQWHGGGSSQLTSGPQDGGKMTEPPCMGGGLWGWLWESRGGTLAWSEV